MIITTTMIMHAIRDNSAVSRNAVIRQLEQVVNGKLITDLEQELTD